MNTYDELQDLAIIKRQHSEIETLRAENERLHLWATSLNKMHDISDQRIFELRKERDAAITHLRAIVDDTLGYAETADAIIDAERWLRKIDGEVTV